jgi:hypothetical protein
MISEITYFIPVESGINGEDFFTFTYTAKNKVGDLANIIFSKKHIPLEQQCLFVRHVKYCGLYSWQIEITDKFNDYLINHVLPTGLNITFYQKKENMKNS